VNEEESEGNDFFVENDVGQEKSHSVDGNERAELFGCIHTRRSYVSVLYESIY
jgi:hypothetical protein